MPHSYARMLLLLLLGLLFITIALTLYESIVHNRVIASRKELKKYELTVEFNDTKII